MPKALTLGNGNMLVCFDKHGQVNDLYYPHVGMEDHIGRDSLHRIGVFVDGAMSWISGSDWQVDVRCMPETHVSYIVAKNKNLGISLLFNDAVYNEKNIFLRRVTVRNDNPRKTTVKIFFCQEWNIYQSGRQDTGYYDPFSHSIIHYEGRRVFLTNGLTSTDGIDDYTVGIYKMEGKDGSYRDAEDGMLSKNPIEHGLTDSVIAFHLALSSQEEQILYYWVVAGKSIPEVFDLNNYVLEKSPEHLVQTTKDFWTAWVNRENFSFYGLSAPMVDLFKRSLFIIRSHVDSSGAVIASGDSDMLQYGRDTYSYMWPRDGAFTIMALDRSGDSYIARKFFTFCNNALTDEGFFMHKYRPDGALGSSWHPWVTKEGEVQLPIQEDETALVLFALWEHYKLTKDLEFVEEIYNSFIQKAANFMSIYRDKETGLPKRSYDLWEEKLGVSTFTCASVYGALNAAANFSRLLGKHEHEKKYKAVAEEIKIGILKHLYDQESGTFRKLFNRSLGKNINDDTLDVSSAYGVFRFGVLSAEDPLLKRAFGITEERLFCARYSGGIARYEGDNYYRIGHDVPGNPWFVSTLWLVQYYIATAKNEKDFDRVKQWFDWVAGMALPTGVLSEQINPYNKEQISAAPLTWSHSEYVLAVIAYLEKIEELGIWKASNLIVDRNRQADTHDDEETD
ncbi:MAG: glycoside hydrolase family 15 protein [Candidatus Paceibacterota bacterium]